MRLTQKQIEKIRKLREKGMSTYKIALKFGVAQSTICYHTDRKQKERVSYDSRKEYQKQYFNNRYKNDEEFRKKHIERVQQGKKRAENDKK